MKQKQQKRFVTVYSDGMIECNQILVDSQTGIQ